MWDWSCSSVSLGFLDDFSPLIGLLSYILGSIWIFFLTKLLALMVKLLYSTTRVSFSYIVLADLSCSSMLLDSDAVMRVYFSALSNLSFSWPAGRCLTAVIGLEGASCWVG